MSCLTENDLVALSEGLLDDAGLAELERHVDACGRCADLVAEFGRAVDVPEGTVALDPHLGENIGPYEVVGWLGSGGMGRVYVAEDTRLERRVALKLVRAGGDEELRARLHDEAVSVAQLSHPNVVAVYDVGEGFVAMERVWPAPRSSLTPEQLPSSPISTGFCSPRAATASRPSPS